MGLSREDIANANDRKVERVDVPEWGEDGHVFVRTMSLREALDINKALRTIEDESEIMSTSLAAFLSDEHGNALFPDAESAKILIDKHPAVLSRLMAAGQKLNHSGSIEGEKEK